ncbi:MAG: hypothetical protein O3C67_09655, partial [Cyanobacteria bacterium]|nr:hypothetical protein [Cyanobacteriota bacterium]
GQQGRLERSVLSGQYVPVTLMMLCVGCFVILLAMTQTAFTFAVIMRLLTVATVLLLFVVVFWLIYRR